MIHLKKLCLKGKKSEREEEDVLKENNSVIAFSSSSRLSLSGSKVMKREISSQGHNLVFDSLEISRINLPWHILLSPSHLLEYLLIP